MKSEEQIREAYETALKELEVADNDMVKAKGTDDEQMKTFNYEYCKERERLLKWILN